MNRSSNGPAHALALFDGNGDGGRRQLRYAFVVRRSLGESTREGLESIARGLVQPSSDSPLARDEHQLLLRHLIEMAQDPSMEDEHALRQAVRAACRARSGFSEGAIRKAAYRTAALYHIGRKFGWDEARRFVESFRQSR